MLITINQLLESGLDISEEINQNKLSLAIATAEDFIIRPRMGELFNNIVADPTAYSELINGGNITINNDMTTRTVYVRGLKYAIFHIAYSYLLKSNLSVTSFGTVEKKDDYSNNVKINDIDNLARLHFEIGLSYVRDITDAYGIVSNVPLNNFFEELL